MVTEYCPCHLSGQTRPLKDGHYTSDFPLSPSPLASNARDGLHEYHLTGGTHFSLQTPVGIIPFLTSQRSLYLSCSPPLSSPSRSRQGIREAKCHEAQCGYNHCLAAIKKNNSTHIPQTGFRSSLTSLRACTFCSLFVIDNASTHVMYRFILLSSCVGINKRNIVCQRHYARIAISILTFISQRATLLHQSG